MPDDQTDETITDEEMTEGLQQLAETVGADPDEKVDDRSSADEPETFPRDYVEQLRQENGKYRQRAQRADDLAQRLHAELVRATGRLADASDLPFNDDHLDSANDLTAAIDDLLARKPHLAARRPMGDVGQGASPAVGTVDLAAILRQRTR